LPVPTSPVPSPAAEHDLALLRHYNSPLAGTTIWQIASTFGLYIGCTAAMYASLRISAWLTLALALPASGLIVRIFMLQHDCGHNALFRSRRANELTGFLCSLATLTPFAYWRRLHARHHGSWNNLDARGIPADFFSDCATLVEYGAMTRVQKFMYRFSHHPLLTHLLLPPVIFILLYRVPFDTPPTAKRERRSVYLLDAALVAIYAGLILLFGTRNVLIVQFPAMVLASIIGIWLFSVQHRFADAQWARKVDWQFASAALHGTSHLTLPCVLQWFSASIGLHHVHHLSPRIPNYRLQACHDACLAVTATASVLTLKQALGASTYALWDEVLRRMVPFPA